jgi:hypothetical protein
MSNCTVLPGSTVLPPTVCTLRHSVAVGGVLVGVGVGVDVGVGVGVGLDVGVLFVPPGGIVGAEPLGVTFVVEPGCGLGAGLELGVIMPPPGEGLGVTGGTRLGWGDSDEVGVELPCAVPAGPAEMGCAVASSNTGRCDTCRARVPERVAATVRAVAQ